MDEARDNDLEKRAYKSTMTRLEQAIWFALTTEVFDLNSLGGELNVDKWEAYLKVEGAVEFAINQHLLVEPSFVEWLQDDLRKVRVNLFGDKMIVRSVILK